MNFQTSVCPTICLYVCLSICLSVCPPKDHLGLKSALSGQILALRALELAPQTLNLAFRPKISSLDLKSAFETWN